MKVKSLKRVVFPFLIVAAAVAALSASLIAYAADNPGSRPANDEYIYSETPFSEEYSIGYFCLKGGEGSSGTKYKTAEQQPTDENGNQLGHGTWSGSSNNLATDGYYGTNTSRSDDVYIDYANGVNMNGTTYDVRQYVWQTDCAYWLVSTDGSLYAEGEGRNAESASGKTTDQVHCEYHFYESGALADFRDRKLTEDELKAKEVTFRGVMRFTDMDKNEGYSFEQGLVNDNVWLYSLTNVKKDTTEKNKWLGTWENGNTGKDTEREMMWVEVTGSANEPLKFTYWANNTHGSGVNYEGNTVTYDIVATGSGGVKPTNAKVPTGIHCATYGKYTLVTEDAMKLDGYLFSGWYKEATLENKAEASVVVSKDQTYYGTYYNLPDVKLTVNKDVEGKVAASTEYSFELKDSGGNLVDTVTTTGSGTADFKDIKYTGTGTYTYTVTEVIPDDAENAAGIKYSAATDEQKQAGGFVKDGVTYGANNVASIKVTVSEKVDEQGIYVTDVEVTKNGTTQTYTAKGNEVCKATVNFTNAYNTEGTLAAGSIQVSKNLTGRDWTDKDSFTFQIAKGTYTAPDDTSYTVDEADYPMPSPTEITATQKNQEPSFGEMKYTIPGTYTYTIKETGYDASSTDLSYDSTTYTVTVSVVDDGKGNLTATVASVVDSSNIAAVDNAITFTNSKPVKTASTHDDEQAGSTVKVGQEITYTIAFDNTSDSEQTINVYDSIPQHTTYTGSADVTVTVNDQPFDLNSNGSIYESKGSDGKVSSISVQLVGVPAHASGTVSFKVTVDESAVQGLADNATTNTIVNDKATVQIGTDGPRVEANPTTTTVKTGSLTVDKIVETRDGSDLPESEQGKKFTVFVYARDLGENALEGSYSVSVGGTAEQKSFTKIEDENDAHYGYGKMELELEGGQSAVIYGLPSGAYFEVLEQQESGTRYEASYNDGKPHMAPMEIPIPYVPPIYNYGTIDADGETITITNTYTPEVDPVKQVFNASATDPTTDVNGQIVGVGDTLTYQIDWTNSAVDANGAPAEAAVVIEDSIPVGTVFTSAVDIAATVGTETLTLNALSTEPAENAWTSTTGYYLKMDASGTVTGIVFYLGSQAKGASGTVSFKAMVDASATQIQATEEYADNTITNEADLSLKVGENSPTKKTTNTTENYVPEKEETSATRTVEAGTVLTYDISFTATAASHEVTDQLFPGLEYAGTLSLKCGDTTLTTPTGYTTTSEGTEPYQTVVWKLTGLTPGETVTLTFQAKVVTSGLEEVTNTVFVDGHSSNEVASPVPQEDSKHVYDEAGTTLLDGATVSVGQTLTYKINWFNDTDASATMKVVDYLPQGVEVVTSTLKDTVLGDGVYNEMANTITWTSSEEVADEAKGTITFQVKVTDPAFEAGEVATLKNKAIVNGFEVSVENYVPTKIAAFDDADNDGKVMSGDVIEYTIAFKNTEDESATVQVKDSVPDGTTYVGESAAAYVDGKAVTATISQPEGGATGDVSWTIKNVPAGAEGTVSFKVIVSDNTAAEVANGTALKAIENQAQVGFGDNPDVWYNTNPTDTPKRVDPEKDVFASDATGAVASDAASIDGKLVQIGDYLLYTISWANDQLDEGGNPTKATITITDTVPEGTSFVKADNSGAEEDGTVTWTITSDPASDSLNAMSGQVSFVVQVDKSAEQVVDNTITNAADVSYKVGDNDPEVRQTGEVTNIVPEKRVATETNDDASGDLVGYGEKLTYSIDWIAEQAGTVTVVDNLPQGLDVDASSISDNGVYSETDRTITWTIKVAEGDATSGVVTFDATVNEKAFESGKVSVLANTAKVSLDNVSSYSVEVENSTPGKSVEVVPAEGTEKSEVADAKVGDELNYTVAWINTSDEASTVYVKDTIPANTVLTSIANGGVAYDENGQAITDASGYANASYVMWKIENVPAAGGNGSEGTVSFKVKVLESAVADAVDGVATITNTAEVGIGIGENDPSYYSKTNTTETDVRTGDLTLSKAIVGGDAAKVFTFDVEVKDAGGNALAGTYSYEGDGTIEGAAGGKVTFASGKATVKLKGGQSVTIAGLPEGATYSVSEQKEAGWTATVVVTDPAAASDEGTDSAPTDSEVDVADDAGAGAGAGTLLSASSIDDSTAAAAIGTGTIGAGAASTVAFTNTYGIDETGAKVDTSTLFSKAISGRAWTDTDKFTFTLTGVDGAPIRTSATAESETSRTTDVTSAGTAADAKVTFGFGELWYTASDLDGVAYAADGTRTKTFTYEVTEKDGGTTTDGLEYSSAKATLTITIKDDGAGNLTAATAGSVVNGEFVNKYTSSIGYSALVDINFTNKLTGRDMAAGDYAFTVTADEETAKKLGLTTEENGHDSPASTSGVTTATVSLHDSLVTFTQDDADKTYSFTIAETKVPGTSGYVNDTTPRKVEVKVTDDHAGTLTVTTSVDGTVVSTVKTGDTTVEPVTIPFENFYSNEPGYIGGEGEGAARIDATKTLIGNELVGEDFSFSVTNAKDSSGTVLATGTNDESGVITFDEIKYTTESLNADYEAKIAERDVTDGVYTYKYVYQVAEDTADLPDGVAAKTSSFQITVDVVDKGDGSALEVGITYPTASDGNLAFVNAYGESATDSVTVAGTKALANDIPQSVVTLESIAGKYTFTLTGVDEDGNAAPLPEKTEASNDAAGNVTFGDIVYTVDNVWGDDGSAATDDDGDGDGGDSDGDGGESEADESQGDAEVESGATQAQTLGSARTKTFTYTVTETGDVSGITNDSESSKTFTVTVTDDGNGAITAVASSDGSLFDFTNTYGVEPVTASVTDSLKATKILTGRNAALATDEFSFELLEGDEVVATGKNDASGNIAMSAITYTEPGTHTYTLREVDAGTLKDGVTYSSESYEVQAVVSDNGDGTLGVAFSRLEQADDGDATDEGTSDTGDTEGTGGDGDTGDATDESADSTDAAMTFTNTYKVSGPASVKLGASKTLTGRTIEDGEFSFELVDESGNVVQTVKNVGSAVNFEALEFSEAGKYTYMMKEVQGSASGITYDSSVYTATITVTDNDKGALEVEVAFSTDDGTAPVFSNTYEAASSTASTSSTTSSANKTTSSSNSTAQTGDSTSIALFAAMFAIAMCCIAVALVRKRNDRLARSRCSQGKHSRR